MADYTVHFGVHQFLRHDGRCFGIGLVVFAEQLEAHLLAAYGDALGIGILNGHARAVFVVLADVRLRPGEWRRGTYLHHHLCCSIGTGSRCPGTGGRFF